MFRNFSFAIVLSLLTVAATARASDYHLTDLNTLGGTRSEATDINALGEVTGNSTVTVSSSRQPWLC